VVQERELDSIELLRRVEIFQMLDAQLRQVRTLLKRQHFRAGETIFLQGDPGDCL
jgi:CRP-like cAMP-binding protein